jgi:molybdate transport system substrate-binding protein
MTGRNRWLIALLLLAPAVAGCGGTAARTEGGAQVRVAVAANLKPAFEEVAAAFRAAHPGVAATPTFGSSGNFYAQLANRAPFDVFLSADTQYSEQLAEQKLSGPPFRYAVGRLVVWVPNDSALDLDKLGVKAAADPSVRKVALANPRHAPYGRAAEAALKAAGVYDAVKPKLVAGDNVEQAAQYAHSGAADLGLVPLSLALTPNMARRGRYVLVPAESHPPLEQAGVILDWAQDKSAAEELRDFLLGPHGREILARHGYEAPRG